MFQIVPNDIAIGFVGKAKLAAIASVLVVLASIAAVVFIGPNYGIDFKGGTDIILRFQEPVTADEIRDAANQAGFPDANVQRFGPEERYEFLVQTSAVSVVDAASVEKVKAELQKLGSVERLVWNEEQPDRLDVQYEEEVTKAAIEGAATAAGLDDVTVESTGVEGRLNYVLRFQDLGQQVREGFAEALGSKFDPQSGVERLETVGPRVGEQLRNSGVLSILVALLLILIYIAFRFDFRYAPGAVAALAHDVVISVGVFTVIQMEISLPIIAALLTIVGYSLNDTIVVFDRIRENLTAEGDSDVPATVNRSLNETLSRTIMTSLTTLIAVLAIYLFGGGLIKDFALALIVGVIVGTYSSVFIASPIMIFMDRYLRTRRESQERAEAAGI